MKKGKEKKFPLSNYPPDEAYNCAMKHEMYYSAAIIARTYDLGDDMIRDAALKAYYRFDETGSEIGKLSLLMDFEILKRVIMLMNGKIFRAADGAFPSIVPGDKDGASQPN